MGISALVVPSVQGAWQSRTSVPRWSFLAVSNMESVSEGARLLGSAAKRPRLELGAPIAGGSRDDGPARTDPDYDPGPIGTQKEHALLDVAERQDFGDLSLLQSSESASDSSPDKLVGTSDLLDTSQDSLEFDDDNASTISHLSGLSDLSGQDWKPRAGSMIWIQKQMQNGINPRVLLNQLGINLDQILQFIDDVSLWKLIINILAEPPVRHKLRHVNTLHDVERLLRGAKNIIVLTGAGVSVSCGIPDFRSRDGIYLRLAVDFPELPDPQAMFDINYFNKDPRPFFKFAKEIYPGKFKPSPCHRFIKLLEKHNRLLRNYTQNIDTLEKEAGIERVVECHGSFATATCTKCGHRVTADEIREPILTQKIPLCEKCHPEKPDQDVNPDDVANENLRELVLSGVMKPDIVFFGEGLPDVFHEAMTEDKNKCDLLLVIGSSLKVRPVALIPSSLAPEVPQVLINREPLPDCHFDVELLGDCDVIVNHICQLLGESWEESVYNPQKLNETLHLLPLAEPKQTQSISTHFEENESACSGYMTDKDITSITNPCPGLSELETKTIKERHMSVDSARDSGIGENSNFTDVDTCKFESADESSDCKSSAPDLRMWEAKHKCSLADRLPPNSFYLVPPSRYVFPGAEIYYDPEEKYNNYFEGSSSSDSSETEMEETE